MTIIPNLEREGGHIAILFVLVILCLGLSLYFPESSLVLKCGDLSLGALLFAMKGNGNKNGDADAADLKSTIKEFGRGPAPEPQSPPQ